MKKLIFMLFLLFTAKNQALANLDIFFNAIQKQKSEWMSAKFKIFSMTIPNQPL